MAIKQEVAYGIVQGLSEYWKCEELQDFTVKIGTSQFGCHRLLLAACSDFFRALFRSGMKETEQNTATLYDISSEIFELLLKSMYTGHDVLTNDNVIDIWKTSHQLQIHFMVIECENFVIKTLSLENYILYLQTSKDLNSTIALDKVWDFVQNNCNHFFETSYFLEISISEVENLVKSQNLEIISEDDVIHAILRWAEFSYSKKNQNKIQSLNVSVGFRAIDNEKDRIEGNSGVDSAETSTCERSKRFQANDNNDFITVHNKCFNSVETELCDEKQYREYTSIKDLRRTNLTILLSNTRTYLASQECLEMLANHSLVRDNREAKNIIVESLLFQLHVGKRNGYWPLRAIHRNKNKFKHCLVNAKKIGNQAEFNFYIFAGRKWFILPSLVDITEVKLAATDKKLYAICTEPTRETYYFGFGGNLYRMRLSINLLKKDTWSDMNVSLILSSHTFSVVMVGSHMFIISAYEMKMWKLETDSYVLTEMSTLPERISICHVMPYGLFILVFYASKDKGINETIVQCYDTLENTWKQANSLKGPAKGMTSFIDEHCTYLLQSNGNMWQVVDSQSKFIDFEFLVRLWSSNLLIYGAVTFMDELYIHGAKFQHLNNDLALQLTLPGVFSKINYILSMPSKNSMSIPFLLERNKEDQEKKLEKRLLRKTRSI